MKYLYNNKKAIKYSIEKAIKLVQNWVEEGSIAGIIDFNRMTRREDFYEIE